VLKTMVQTNTLRPVWHSFQTFAVIGEPEDEILFEIYNKKISPSRLISSVRIKVDELDTEPENFPLAAGGLKRWNRMSSDYEQTTANLVLRRVKYTGGAEIHKTVYFIRHGLSAWNEAQDAGDLAGLLNKDHPLTAEGVEQCLKLRYRWQAQGGNKAAPRAELGSLRRYFEDKFSTAGKVFTSPLTRALQTALLSLEGHQGLEDEGITCLRSAREIKGVGGLDNLGKAVGPEMRERALAELTTVAGRDYAEMVAPTVIHPGDCDTQWWTTFKDTKASTRKRFKEFWARLCYQHEDTIIVVGHSNFFKQAVKMTAKRMACDSVATAKQLASGKHKLQNNACLGVDIRFALGHPPEIVNAELLFDTDLENTTSNTVK